METMSRIVGAAASSDARTRPWVPLWLVLSAVAAVAVSMPACSPPGIHAGRGRLHPLLLRGGGADDHSADAGINEPTGGKYACPAFVQHRLAVLARARARASAAAAAAGTSAPGPIAIALPDGSTVQGEAGSTSPMAVANGISKQLASSSVVALVDGELWDMNRPLERSCALEVLPFDDPRAQQVFWHSSAHILGQALELQRGALLVTGPATEEGFFYDVHVAASAPAPHDAMAGTGKGTGPRAGEGAGAGELATLTRGGMCDSAVISSEHLLELEHIIANITRQKQPFERVELTKEEALEMFHYNPFKCAIIRDKVPDGGSCTAYRCGPLIDLCRGPHLPHTGVAKAFWLTKNSAAYWKGSAQNVALQVPQKSPVMLKSHTKVPY